MALIRSLPNFGNFVEKLEDDHKEWVVFDIQDLEYIQALIKRIQDVVLVNNKNL